MMTQYEYWLLVQRYEALDEKKEDCLSVAEWNEFGELDARIANAYMERNSLVNGCVRHQKITP